MGPRLQRLYASEATASHIRWHAEHHTEDGEIIHLSDAQAWLTFNDMHLKLHWRFKTYGLVCHLMVLSPLEVQGNNIHRACDCHPIQSSTMYVYEEVVYVRDGDRPLAE